MFGKKQSIEYLIVGLGNPGRQYDNTRHNVGFRVLDFIAQEAGVTINRSKFEGLTATAEIGGASCLLLKPQTFMNLSGRAIAGAANFYKIPPERVIVVFDDISLPVGRLRIRKDGSPGGHNGIKSTIAMLASGNFPRVKVGVGEKPHPDYDLANWVLSKFDAKEEKDLGPAIKRAGNAVEVMISQGIEKASSMFNGKQA